jgi:hypothetical protein
MKTAELGFIIALDAHSGSAAKLNIILSIFIARPLGFD